MSTSQSSRTRHCNRSDCSPTRSSSFTEHCVTGIRADEARIRELMERSLMLVTALAPAIGYERAQRSPKLRMPNGTTLREEAIRLGYVSADDFDRLVRPDQNDASGTRLRDRT